MKNNAFTLIELLVAMGIVAVLTAMAVFNFNQSRVRARDISRKSDLTQLQKALELYKNDNGVNYPAVLETKEVPQTELGSFIKTIFNDPRYGDWENYQYYSENQRGYLLGACLENTADQSKSSGANCLKFGTDCTCNSGKGVRYIITQP